MGGGRRAGEVAVGPGGRRTVLRTALGALALSMLSGATRPGLVTAHHHHKRRRKRCDKHCKNNHRTCDRGCDILDDDSQEFCKQGCRVALSQCKSDC